MFQQPDFTGTEWDLIRSGAQDGSTAPDHSDIDYEYNVHVQNDRKHGRGHEEQLAS